MYRYTARSVLLSSFLLVRATQGALRDLQTLDEVCSTYAADIEHPNGGTGVYSCNCTGNATEFTASCSYAESECATWPGEMSPSYFVDYTFTRSYANGEQTPEYEDCVYYRSTCNRVCLGYNQASGDYGSIDGANCNSMQFCNGNNFVLDCDNLIPGMVVNSCTGDGLQGSPFEVFKPDIYETSIFRSGTCGADNSIPVGLNPDNCKANDLDDVCEEYAASLKHPNGYDGKYTCDCQGESSIIFEATCQYEREECAISPPLSSQYSVIYTFTAPFNNSVPTGELVECLYYTDTCNSVCVGMKEPAEYYATVDGTRFASMTLCDETTLDFVLDCSNIIPGAKINTCTGEGQIEGSPFQPFDPKFYDGSVYTPGRCSAVLVPLGLSTDNCLPEQEFFSEPPTTVPISTIPTPAPISNDNSFAVSLRGVPFATFLISATALLW